MENPTRGWRCSDLAAAALAACLLTAHSTARADLPLSSWQAAGSVAGLFPSLAPPLPTAMGFTSDALDFMWACPGAATCAGAGGPPVAVFQKTLALPLLSDGHFHGGLHILADDYFALYVNNQLVTKHFGGPDLHWLDDTLVGGLPQAVSYDNSDLVPLLLAGQDNVFTIVACNGYPPAQRMAPGATLDQALTGCPTPSNRVNHWLLVEGYVDYASPTAPGALFDMNGGSVNAWFVATVPEPASQGLTVLALVGLIAASKARRPAPRAAALN